MSIQAGSYGYVLSLDTGLDLSTATAVNLLIKPLLSPAVVKAIPLPAGLVDGPSGKIAYQVVQGDFLTPGVYHLQVQDVSPGRSVFSTVTSLVVEANLA